MTEKPITFDRVVRWVGTGLLIIGIILLLNRLSHVLLPFFVAWFFAYLLYPMVKFVERRLHLPRALSIIIALIVVIAIISGIVYLIIPPMIEQFEKLGNLATDYIQKSAHITSIPGAFSEWITDNEHEIQQFFKSKDFSDGMKAIMPELFNFLGQTYSVIVSVIASFIALLYMFFILLDYEYLTDNWIRIFPKKNRPFWQELAKDVERELNNYIRGQGLVALIMGVLVMRLNEFRMSEGKGMNLPLRHVTVLEEAHNLLKATSTAQSQEGSNVLGKSVEMISSSIAEMRTYGEGFIIADQSPSMLDRSAISNTNTKIIMALPNKDDRDIAAGSTSLTDQQKNEVSRLKTGVAVVFQKGWEEAVLCKIDHYNADERPYKYKKTLELPLLDADGDLDEQLANIPDDNEPQCLTKLLLAGYSGEVEPDIETLVTVLFDDRNLTGKQRYDLALRLDMISQDMDPELVNYDMEGQPHNPSDICAILFAQLVGIEAFAGISAKSKDINELNSAVLQLIREEGSTPISKAVAS